MSVSDCLVGIVGLSANDCACFEDNRPADYNTSLSGHYIDDPEYGFPLNIPKNIRDCGENNLWDIMARARLAGVNQFLTDFGANLLSGPFKKRVEPFNDWVGGYKWNMNLSTFDDYVGIQINPYIFRGTMGKIYQIELYISGRDGDMIELGFYDEQGLADNAPVATVDIEIVNGKGIVTLDETYLYDFMNNYSQKNKLWLLYEPGAGLPRNTTVRNCSTCSSKNKWDNYMSVQGVTADATSDIIDLTTYSGYSYGLRINMGVSCGNTWLCQNWDYDNDNWARIMAECIALYGIKKLAGIILNEPGPNRYTQITREEVAFHRDRANKLLEARMPWLAENVPQEATDCFTCNNKIAVRELMV